MCKKADEKGGEGEKRGKRSGKGGEKKEDQREQVKEGKKDEISQGEARAGGPETQQKSTGLKRLAKRRKYEVAKTG